MLDVGMRIKRDHHYKGDDLSNNNLNLLVQKLFKHHLLISSWNDCTADDEE